MSALCMLSNLSVILVPRAERGICSKQLDYWLKFFSLLMICLDVDQEFAHHSKASENTECKYFLGWKCLFGCLVCWLVLVLYTHSLRMHVLCITYVSKNMLTL